MLGAKASRTEEEIATGRPATCIDTSMLLPKESSHTFPRRVRSAPQISHVSPTHVPRGRHVLVAEPPQSQKRGQSTDDGATLDLTAEIVIKFEYPVGQGGMPPASSSSIGLSLSSPRSRIAATGLEYQCAGSVASRRVILPLVQVDTPYQHTTINYSSRTMFSSLRYQAFSAR